MSPVSRRTNDACVARSSLASSALAHDRHRAQFIAALLSACVAACGDDDAHRYGGVSRIGTDTSIYGRVFMSGRGLDYNY